MQKLAEVCIKRPVFAAMIVLALVVVGSASYFRLGVDRFPSVDLPTVAVRTSLPGASPEEIESEVSRPIEEAVNTVDGIDQLRSISSQGVSVVVVTFKLDRKIDIATQDVRDRVSSVIRDLPTDTLPPVVQKFDNDSAPVITIALSSDRSIRELTELAAKTVKTQLERAGGVGEVDIVGGFLFLLPICVIFTYFTWPWFVQSWNLNEASSNAGGLLRWPVKLLLPVGFGLMILQGISELIKRIAALEHVIDIEFKYEKPLQ